jgi:hypothetical protein
MDTNPPAAPAHAQPVKVYPFGKFFCSGELFIPSVVSVLRTKRKAGRIVLSKEEKKVMIMGKKSWVPWHTIS